MEVLRLSVILTTLTLISVCGASNIFAPKTGAAVCKTIQDCPPDCRGNVVCEYGMCSGCDLVYITDTNAPELQDITLNSDMFLDARDPCNQECSCPHLMERITPKIGRMSWSFRYKGICVCSTTAINY